MTVTYAATDVCLENKRQTIGPQDVLTALDALGFEQDDLDSLTQFLERDKERRPKHTAHPDQRKYRGVYQGSINAWYSQISIGGQPIHLGSYAAPADAAKAYDRAIWSKLGVEAAALLNFPELIPESLPYVAEAKQKQMEQEAEKARQRDEKIRLREEKEALREQRRLEKEEKKRLKKPAKRRKKMTRGTRDVVCCVTHLPLDLRRGKPGCRPRPRRARAGSTRPRRLTSAVIRARLASLPIASSRGRRFSRSKFSQASSRARGGARRGRPRTPPGPWAGPSRGGLGRSLRWSAWSRCATVQAVPTYVLIAPASVVIAPAAAAWASSR